MRPTSLRRLPHKAFAVPIALAVISAVVVTLALARGAAREPATALNPAFLQKINRLCAREAPALRSTRRPYPGLDAGHPRATELPAVGAYFAPRAAILVQIANALRGLGEPASGRGEWDHVRHLVARYANVAVRQVTLARAADARGFVATENEISTLRDELIDSASALGFTLASPCARSL